MTEFEGTDARINETGYKEARAIVMQLSVWELRITARSKRKKVQKNAY